MTESVAYFNGSWIPASQAGIPLYDTGFVLGVTVTEQLRTFSGRLFHLEQHLERFRRSLDLVGLEIGLTDEDMQSIALRLVELNHPRLASGEDLGLAIFATPGPLRSLSGGHRAGPTICLHTFPLAFELWAEKYEAGQSLVVTDVKQVPAECWPASLKCRSRMHYYLADQEADRREPGARALLTDFDGFVTETSTANVLAYREAEGLLVPPRGKVLAGISLQASLALARELDMPIKERPLRPADVAAADEVFLTSTPYCILPVVRLDGQPIGAGQPGSVYRQLLGAWSRLVGLDLAGQAAQAAGRAAGDPDSTT